MSVGPHAGGRAHHISMDSVPPCVSADERASRFWSVAASKRRQALHLERRQRCYYDGLLRVSASRSDAAALRDRRQVEKDLPRTFGALPVAHGEGGSEALLPLLWSILAAYIERGRALSAYSALGMQVGGAATSAATTARSLLTGYPQGLNFLAGMCLLCIGGNAWDGEERQALEEGAFWLLAGLLEDVLDPDFFGVDVRSNLRMAYVGGLGMRTLVADMAESRCPAVFEALGAEVFRSSLFALLDPWILSLFVGCVPARFLDEFWDLLLLPSTQLGTGPQEMKALCGRGPPSGLSKIIAFALAALQCCMEEELANSEALRSLDRERREGTSAEVLSLHAAESVQGVRVRLLRWAPERDCHLLGSVRLIAAELEASEGGAAALWDAVRRYKQRIAACVEDYDEQLVTLVARTHFSVHEIDRLRTELAAMQRAARSDDGGRRQSRRSAEGLSLEMFSEVVGRVVPDFPHELRARLFRKLDAFGVGRLAFTELACGMSALSLGTMDEKLRVCFDLFDSEGRCALTLKDLGDLCALLFRVALAQGLPGAQTASTDEVLDRQPTAGGSPQSQSDTEQQVISDRFRHTIASQPMPRDSTVSAHDGPQPWRSMLLRLLAAARVPSPGGPWLVSFEDFRAAASTEPMLLRLFSWCLPLPPDAAPTGAHSREGVAPGLCTRLRSICAWLFGWWRGRRERRRLLPPVSPGDFV